jgi:DNA-binding response OmpR family regulator
VKPSEVPMEGPLVLVVDDDSTVREVVTDALTDGGFGCRNASSGEEAIGLLNADRCQALIVDIGFGPDHVKGWSVARRARSFDASLPVIYITGGSADDWSVHGVPSSVVLTKPFAPAQLLAALSQLLNKTDS